MSSEERLGLAICEIDLKTQGPGGTPQEHRRFGQPHQEPSWRVPSTREAASTIYVGGINSTSSWTTAAGRKSLAKMPPERWEHDLETRGLDFTA